MSAVAKTRDESGAVDLRFHDSFSVALDFDISDPPSRFLRALAAGAFEAVEGTRAIAQLGASITVGAARLLAEQRNAVRERSSAYRDLRASSPSPGRAHVCRTSLRVAEASVTMHTGTRSHAMSMRLEWLHSRWKATEIYVL